MRQSKRAFRQRGQTAIMVTLSLPLMFGLMGFVVDVGWGYWREEAAKTAASAAAEAAARQAELAPTFTSTDHILTQSTTASCAASPSTTAPVDNLTTGCLYAKANGFTNSGKQKVMYKAGTTSSPVAGSTPNYWARYTVTETIPSLFTAVLGMKSLVVSARSTSGVFYGASGSCLYALNYTAPGAITLQGNTDVHAGCGVYDNSNSTTSLSCGGSSSLNAGTAPILISGSNACGSHATPTPSTNQPRTQDPFLYTPTPTIPAGHAACDSTGLAAGNTVTMPSDGYYVICNGGITMNSNGSLSLPAGIYYLQGGGVNWQNGTVTGTGVTIYLTNPLSGGTASTGFKINGNMTIHLSAPTSGSYRGLVVFQDRTLAVGSKFNGGAGMDFQGTIYMPDAAISYAGGAATDVTALVGDTIVFTGTSYFGTDNHGAITGIGTPIAAQIE
ncbi:MAG TPA: pilus assembly protein TadG-related protein [Candidatus Sulfopaludibacter sp.]|jgi:Flp pilus assembly protein TadG|nr:pilus assembly protein TadG-related protein [Candidatus Sulfopaludibacter sp.]